MKTLPFFAALLSGAVLFPALSRAAVATQPEQFSGTYTATTFTQYDGVAVYGSTNSGNFSSLAMPLFTSVAVNAPFTVPPTTVQVPVGATNLRVAVFSVYGSATSSTVSLTLDPTYAASIISGNATAFSAAFGGQSEATIASYIQGAAINNSAAITGLEGFFNAFSADFPLINSSNTATGTVTTFSNAAFGGTAGLNLAPVPEPGTNLLLLAGAAGVAAVMVRKRWAN